MHIKAADSLFGTAAVFLLVLFIVNLLINDNISLPLWGRWQSEGLTDEVGRYKTLQHN